MLAEIRPQMLTSHKSIGARLGVSPNSKRVPSSQMAEAIAYRMLREMGSPQMFEGQLNIGAIAESRLSLTMITDRMSTAAGLLLISLRGLGLVSIRKIADGRQEETAAGGRRRRRRRRNSSSAAPKANLPRGSPRSRSAGGPKGEGMMGSP